MSRIDRSYDFQFANPRVDLGVLAPAARSVVVVGFADRVGRRFEYRADFHPVVGFRLHLSFTAFRRRIPEGARPAKAYAGLFELVEAGFDATESIFCATEIVEGWYDDGEPFVGDPDDFYAGHFHDSIAVPCPWAPSEDSARLAPVLDFARRRIETLHVGRLERLAEKRKGAGKKKSAPKKARAAAAPPSHAMA